MKASWTVIIAIVCMLVAGAPVFAHHSWAGAYVESERATITGALVEIVLRSPHSFVVLEALDAKTGEPVRWTAEGSSLERLGREDIHKDTLKIGDRVTVLGRPGRNPEEHRLHMLGMARPSDGFKWGEAID